MEVNHAWHPIRIQFKTPIGTHSARRDWCVYEPITVIFCAWLRADLYDGHSGSMEKIPTHDTYTEDGHVLVARVRK